MNIQISRRAIIAIALVIGGLGALLVALQTFTEAVDAGHHLRPYDSGVVHKVEVGDFLTVYVDDESKRIGADLISGMVLVALATAAAITLLLLSAAGAAKRLRVFYALSALGLGFLAFDELGAIHETLGHNMPFLVDLPGVHRPDDVVYAVYVLPALAFLFFFRDILASSRLGRRLFVGAFALFVIAGLLDVAGLALDEPFEILVAVAIAAGFVSLMVTHLSEHLNLSASRDAESVRS